MFRIIFGIFIILHGLVHLLYFGQSTRYFELQPGMVWPDGAWAGLERASAASKSARASLTCPASCRTLARRRCSSAYSAAGTASGTLQSLDQGTKDIPLSAITCKEGAVHFEATQKGGAP